MGKVVAYFVLLFPLLLENYMETLLECLRM